jgi:SAM-dependent methyltransferase
VGDGQTTAFSSGEGDRYFERNRAAATAYDVDSDPLVRLLSIADVAPGSVIEIGAASGHRVAALSDRWGCRAVAVDPSNAAVEEGRRRYPHVEFAVGTMDEVPIDDVFSLVVVSFVLHWVGRSLLLRSIAELDRLVADGGHLAIGDFLPAGFAKTPYKHQAGLWTFKQDYAEVFCSSGLYSRVASLVGEYGGEIPSGGADPAHRAGYFLLHKSLDTHYQQVTID